MKLKLSILYIKWDQILPIFPISVNGSFILDSFLSLISYFQTNRKFYYICLETIFRTWSLLTTSTANDLVQTNLSLIRITSIASKLISILLSLPHSIPCPQRSQNNPTKMSGYVSSLHKTRWWLFISWD